MVGRWDDPTNFGVPSGEIFENYPAGLPQTIMGIG
jgi:hypothetical protein